jgi:nucleoside-diphosphate-sugar epimerase
MTILITGSAGFIGFHLIKKLYNEINNVNIVGIDNFNDYYDVNLKLNRSNILHNDFPNYIEYKYDISNKKQLDDLFNLYNFDIVINLAAQAGVRYSIENPDVYIQSNIIGFYNILECCRNHNKLKHLIFASSSSVYGNNENIPFDENDNVDKPVSLYAMTKKSNELIAYTYSKLYNINCTGLRFFTVYGPYGRPDMAYYTFTKKLLNNETINIFNNGNCLRDFTYIDDIVEGIYNIVIGAPNKYEIYNIGNNKPEKLLDFVNILIQELVSQKLLPESFAINKNINLLEAQPGDVEITYANIDKIKNKYKFVPKISLKEGLNKFINWYKNINN